jgi:hypothetical protein
VPLEHGLQSTLVAMRLAERLGVDPGTASQTYYACLLFYVGCTADAEVAAETFGDDDALTTYALPARFGSPPEMMAGIMRALASSGSPAPVRAAQMARGLPRAAREFKGHITAFCEVAQMLTDRLGLPASMQGLFAYLVERWDGKGLPGRARGEAIPLPVRIASVARDAAFQHLLGGAEFAAGVVRKRAGGAFDPAVAIPLADAAAELLALDADASAWEETLAGEPGPLGLGEHGQDAAQRAEHRLAGAGDLRLDVVDEGDRRAGGQGGHHRAERGGGGKGRASLADLRVDLVGGELGDHLALVDPGAVGHQQAVDPAGGGRGQVGLGGGFQRPGRVDPLDHVRGAHGVGREAPVRAGAAGAEDQRGGQQGGRRRRERTPRPVLHPAPLPCPSRAAVGRRPQRRHPPRTRA